MKLFQNLSTVKQKKLFKAFLYLQPWWPFCSTEWNHLSNFGRGLAKKHFCEIISKSVHRFNRRSCLKLFSIYSPGGHFVQQSRTVCAILVHTVTYGTFLYDYFKIDAWVKEEKSFIGFSIISSGGHLVQRSRTV